MVAVNRRAWNASISKAGPLIVEANQPKLAHTASLFLSRYLNYYRVSNKKSVCCNYCLLWVPEHRAIVGNKTAHQLAKEVSQITFTGLKLGLGITKGGVRGAINEWAVKHQSDWNHLSRQRHGKRIMERPSKLLTATYLHQTGFSWGPCRPQS